MEDNKRSYFTQRGHAWAEVYFPFYGWAKVDPTWGIEYKDMYFCFNEPTHIAEEYGVYSIKEFGSLQKGWSLQTRRKRGSKKNQTLGLDQNIRVDRLSFRNK